jgi:hypothetical protein
VLRKLWTGRIRPRSRWVLAAVLCAVAASGAVAGPAQAKKFYGNEFWWGCTYSWGTACIEPHYETSITFLRSMDPDNAHEWLPQETENRYKAPVPDNIERCVGAAVWNGSQTKPWVAGWGYVDALYPGGTPGYGMIGTCVAYYQIALYQYVNWGEP